MLEWVTSDWLRGKLNGNVGLVPRTYVLTEGAGSDSNVGNQAGSIGGIAGTTVTAARDYYNAANDHLCFSKGDRIEVIEEVLISKSYAI